MYHMDYTFSKLIFRKTVLPSFWKYPGSTPGSNNDDPKKFKKKIKVNVLVMVTDPQTTKVIRKKSAIMNHPIDFVVIISFPALKNSWIKT